MDNERSPSSEVCAQAAQTNREVVAGAGEGTQLWPLETEREGGKYLASVLLPSSNLLLPSSKLYH